MAKVIYEGYLKPDDPRWRDDWSITVGPGATRGSDPPFANTPPPSSKEAGKPRKAKGKPDQSTKP